MLEFEVNNNGFEQYFYNSAGDYALLTEKALKAIGSSAFLKLFQKAISFFPDNRPDSNKEVRRKQMDHWDNLIKENLYKLDHEFSTYKEDIHLLIYQYCHKNSEQIKFDDHPISRQIPL